VVIAWRPSRRLLAIAFFVSLVLNLFLAGLVVGHLAHGELWPWRTHYAREFGPFAGRALDRLVHSLDESDRQTVIETMRAHGAELARLGKAMHDQREAIEQLIRAPQFDRKTVEAAFAEMRKRGDEMQMAMGTALLDAIEKLPPQARQRLAQ
jgi:Spy/CpxP family protein refolding chaperone